MSELTGRPAERRIGVFTTDVDLVIKSWDPALEQMTGIVAAEACGRDLHALIPDLAARVPPQLLREPLISGSVQVLAPALHKYLIPCPPAEPSTEFDRMQQRVVVGALRNDEGAAGLVVTVEDVTARLERERELGRQLREGAPSERVAAIRRLAELDSEGVGPIGHALGDEDWQVRRAAVRALAAKRDAALVDTVIAALRDGHRNFSLLSSALELLSTTGVDVTEALISLMGHADADLRIQATLALGMQRRPEAIEALLAAFDDPDVNVRFHAVEAIGKQAHPAAIDRLCDLATSGDFFLAFPAVEALVRVGDPLAAARLAPLLDDPMLAGVVAEALGRIGDEDAVAALVRALERDAAPVEPIVVALAEIHRRYRLLFDGAIDIEDIVAHTIGTRGTERIVAALERAASDSLKHVVTVLSWINDPAIPPALATLLGSADVRHEVVEALVRCAGPAVDLLVQQLAADDVDTKRAAVVALGRMGDPRATEPLVKLLDNDDERALWIAITGALARLGDRRAFESLLNRLGDCDIAVRQGAIGALNSIGHPGMAERIVPMIDDANPFVRESAIRIAGYFGYPSCADATLARCLDPDEPVRAAALEHLPYFEDDRALGALARAVENDTPRARAAAARALGSMLESSAQQLLSRALDDSDQWVRYFAAIGLGRQANPHCLNRLITLARNDAAVPVAVAAIDAAAAIGTDEAVAAVATIAAQPDDRGIAALSALGKLPSGRTTPVLQDALRSSDARRRLTAVRSLVSHGTAESVDALAWTATADADPDVARAATAGLREIAGRAEFASGRAVRALVDTLRDPSRRGDTLDALAHIAATAIPELASALDSDQPQLRRGVVEALGRLNHPAASAALLKSLSDGDAVVRRTAIVGLSRIGTRGLRRRLTAIARSDSSPAVRQAATVALNRRTSGEGDE